MINNKVVNLVYWRSGAGIDRDVKIVEDALRESGYQTRHVTTAWCESKAERITSFLKQWFTLLFPVKAQFHFQKIYREQFRHGRNNFVFVNPEFTDPHVFEKMKRKPVVLCKTRHGDSLFDSISVQSLYTGFTSEDHLIPDAEKDFGKFIHVAGLSDYKGTGQLVTAWQRNPQWPQLTIIRAKKDRLGNMRRQLPSVPNIEVIDSWIDEAAYRKIQNEAGIHLCPSEMEGFGHYIGEAMAVGSIVITTDAPPMNEFIDPDCGYVVSATKFGEFFMSDRWKVDIDALERCVNHILETPLSERTTMGKMARERYLEMDKAYAQRMSKLIKSL